LSGSKIELIFLPPYAPNLNLIERYWRFFRKEILYGKYYESFALFKRDCDDFFAASERYKGQLTKRKKPHVKYVLRQAANGTM
jgi:hypothetical protein